MLILKAFVNENQIDEIWVQNVHQLGFGLCIYKIKKPSGEYPVFLHNRQDGWMCLAMKALEIIDK